MSNIEPDQKKDSGKLYFLLAMLGVVALIYASYAYRYAGFIRKFFE